MKGAIRYLLIFRESFKTHCFLVVTDNKLDCSSNNPITAMQMFRELFSLANYIVDIKNKAGFLQITDIESNEDLV